MTRPVTSFHNDSPASRRTTTQNRLGRSGSCALFVGVDERLGHMAFTAGEIRMLLCDNELPMGTTPAHHSRPSGVRISNKRVTRHSVHPNARQINASESDTVDRR